MKKLNLLKEGFTLVEIMIVVVIIGLLAAMAIPAFRKVRGEAIRKTVVNDARLVGNAAQQYFMDKGVTTCPVSRIVGSAGSNYLKNYSRGNTIDVADVTAAATFIFQMSNPLLGTSALTFNNEGRLVGDPY